MTQNLIQTVINLIADANPDRDFYNLGRRVLKLIEELGEVAEAFLECTSVNNRKQKSWDDVKEEAADVLIVAIDIALTVSTPEKLGDFVMHNVHRYKTGFDITLRELCYSLARFDGLRNSHPVVAFRQIGIGVCYAFSINSSLRCYEPDDTGILTDVNRKLDKWKSGTSTAQAAE